MFGFGKKNIGINFSTDIHCHILPGLDDGSATMEESLGMARAMEQAGIKTIYATPHIKSDIYPNDLKTIKASADEFSAELRKAGIGIKLNFAAEYYIDMFFIERLESGEDLLTLGEKYVLVESSLQQEPMYLFDVLFKLQSRGYRPIMAHPERYAYYGKDPAPFRKMKKAGCLLQMNFLSLGGHYGKPVRDIARMLIENDLVSLVGTDFHRTRHTDLLKDRALLKAAAAFTPGNDSLLQ